MSKSPSVTWSVLQEKASTKDIPLDDLFTITSYNVLPADVKLQPAVLSSVIDEIPASNTYPVKSIDEFIVQAEVPILKLQVAPISVSAA